MSQILAFTRFATLWHSWKLASMSLYGNLMPLGDSLTPGNDFKKLKHDCFVGCWGEILKSVHSVHPLFEQVHTSRSLNM